ncbi:C-type lectin domain family 4 member E [Garra rufa]|uniref:C-type lectin domain family 4 member E n=1 Tax=Garra rufa TaxID=137080 RepID=UPI003CCE88FD
MQEKQQLITKNEKLMSKNDNLTSESEQLILKNTNLTNERQQLILKNTNLTNERQQLILKNTNLTNDRQQLRNELKNCDGWIYYQFSCYYISNETKTWSDSKNDCLNRGADLIIINNSEEQNFVNMSGNAGFHIGLSKNDVAGTWKWVDGTNVTYK